MYSKGVLVTGVLSIAVFVAGLYILVAQGSPVSTPLGVVLCYTGVKILTSKV